MKSLLLVIALFLLTAGAAVAAGTWTTCDHPDRSLPDPQDLQTGDVICWDYDADDDTPGFRVRGKGALVCFDPDTATEGAAGATVMPRRCPIGYKPATNPERQCIKMRDVALDGTEGAIKTQKACEALDPGAHYCESTATCSAAGLCRIAIEVQ